MTTIRRRYLVLHGLRWLPSGLLIPVIVLLMLERGIGLSQIGLIFAIQGFVVNSHTSPFDLSFLPLTVAPTK